MARTFGQDISTLSSEEQIFFNRIISTLPDYIYVGVNVSMDDMNIDCLLLFPHIGVFVIEIRSYSELRYIGGNLVAFTQTGENHIVNLHISYKNRKNLEKHFFDKFHIIPYICELNYFPKFVFPSEMKEEVALSNVLNPEHIVCLNDFDDAPSFMAKLLNIYSSEICKSNPPYRPFYEYTDLSDELILQILHTWKTGVKPIRPETPPLAFISYSSKNNVTASEIQKKIESLGNIYAFKCDNEVSCGEDYEHKVRKAIEDCDAFILLLSPASKESPEVKKEVQMALELNKPIFPIRLDNCTYSDNEFYCNVLKHRQHKPYSIEDDSVIDEIIEAIEHMKKRKE